MDELACAEWGFKPGESDDLSEAQVVRLMDSYLQRQKFLARLQALEVGKLLMGSGDSESRPAAGTVSADALLGRMGVRL